MGKNITRKNGFIDYSSKNIESINIKGKYLRCIKHQENLLFNLNDLKKMVNITTESSLVAKTLNNRGISTYKILTKGNANPSWFTNKTGIISYVESSKKFQKNYSFKNDIIEKILTKEEEERDLARQQNLMKQKEQLIEKISELKQMIQKTLEILEE